ncbi:organic anion transporter 3-like [Amblyomma americanum]
MVSVPEWGLAPMQRLLALLVASSNFFLAFNTIGSAFVLPGGLPIRCGDSWNRNACTALHLGACGRIEFEPSDAYGRRTAVHEFGLVCERRWLVPLCQCLSMAGLALGALAFGRLSDRNGRRSALLCGAAVHAVGCLGSVAAPSAPVYALCRLLTSVGAASAPSLDVLLVESLEPRLRYVDSVAISAGFSLGAVCAAWLSPALPSWRGLHALMLLNAALILACSGLVHESARWLLSRGRLDEAQRVVASSARFNGLPEGEVQRLVLGMAADAPKDGASVTARPLCDLFRSRTLRFYTIFMWFQATVLGMSYYTSSLTGTEIGGSSPQLDFSLLYAAELTCNLLGCAAASRLPRKPSLTALALALAAAHTLLALALGRYVLRLAAALLVKGLVSSQVLLCLLHVNETYPTGLRAFGVSAFQCLSWAAASLEPFARDVLGPAVLALAYATALVACAMMGLCLLRETLTSSLGVVEEPPAAVREAQDAERF